MDANDHRSRRALKPKSDSDSARSVPLTLPMPCRTIDSARSVSFRRVLGSNRGTDDSHRRHLSLVTSGDRW